MKKIYSIKDVYKEIEIEIEIFRNPEIKNEFTHENQERLFNSYYGELKRRLGDDYIKLLNDIKLVIINFGMQFIKNLPDNDTFIPIVETLSKQYIHNYFCYKFFGENFPINIYKNGEIISQYIIIAIEKQKECIHKIELHQYAIHISKDSNIIKEHKKAIHIIMAQLEDYNKIKAYKDNISMFKNQIANINKENFSIIKNHNEAISRIEEILPRIKDDRERQLANSRIEELIKAISEIEAHKTMHLIAIQKQVDAMIELHKETMSRIEAREEAISEMEKAISEMEKAISEMEKSSGEMEKSSGEMEKASGEMEKSSGEMEKASGEMGKTSGEMEGLPFVAID